jgi:hypothetical protein
MDFQQMPLQLQMHLASSSQCNQYYGTSETAPNFNPFSVTPRIIPWDISVPNPVRKFFTPNQVQNFSVPNGQFQSTAPQSVPSQFQPNTPQWVSNGQFQPTMPHTKAQKTETHATRDCCGCGNLVTDILCLSALSGCCASVCSDICSGICQ